MDEGVQLNIVKSLARHIRFYLSDLITPLMVPLRTPKSLLSSRDQVLALIDYMKPVNTNQPLKRFGPEGDGGYLAPDDFEEIEACFSPGVSDVAGFEMEFANRGIPCFLIDASVEEPPVEHENINFEPLFLGAKSDGVKLISLEDWVNKKAPGDKDLLLQIDIEGAEYEALLSAPEDLLKRFRVIVMELHDLDFLMTNKYAAIGFEAFLTHLRKVFHVVHIHPNNNRRPISIHGIEIPPVIEITYVRKDRISNEAFGVGAQLPNVLDSDNSPRRNHIRFSIDWNS